MAGTYTPGTPQAAAQSIDQPVAHGFAPMPDPQSLPFARFGLLLPVLILSMVPALILLYVSKVIGSQILYLGAASLTLLLIFGASVVLAVSGILGLIEYRKYLGMTNHHPKPSRHHTGRRY